METFKTFVDNSRILGFKEKLPLIREIIDEQSMKKYENLFYSLNILSEEIYSLGEQNIDNNILNHKKKFSPLKSNELQIYNKYFESNDDNNISEFNENQQLLELALDEINNDEYLLDLELENLEQEIALNEEFLKNELTDNELLKKRKENTKNHNTEFFSHKIHNFKKDNIDLIKQETLLLNKSLKNIGSELDLNIKKSPLQSNLQSFIVGFRKINDTQFDEAIKLLIDIIYQLEYNYDKIQRKIKLENNENNKDDMFNIYMKEINKTEEQMKKVMNTEIELNKNIFLSFIKKSKTIYENNLIKEYLKNPKCLDEYYYKYIEKNQKNKNDISSSAIRVNLSKKIKEIFALEENEIYNKFMKIKNGYYQKILNNYLSNKFQNQIIFIENLEKYEKILNSIYPYIIEDEKVTQQIYDFICEVTDIYGNFQSKIGVKQGFLRLKYSKIFEPINKITIDERDDILLKLAKEYLNENNEENERYNKSYLAKIKNDKNNEFQIYEIKKIIDKLLYLFKSLKTDKFDNLIDKIYLDVISHFKDFISFIKIFLNNQDYLIGVKKYNKQFKSYQDNTKFILYQFNQNIDKIIIKNNIKAKSNLGVISIYDALFLYFFHRDIYNKEFGNKFIFK
jgi:hypothetical protein